MGTDSARFGPSLPCMLSRRVDLQTEASSFAADPIPDNTNLMDLVGTEA